MSLVFGTNLPPTDKLIALCLADHSRDDGTHVYPSIATLAEKASMGTTATRGAVRRLEECGVLIKVRDGGGRSKPTEYRFDVDLLQNSSESGVFTKPNASAMKPNASEAETQRISAETQRIGVAESSEPTTEPSEPPVVALATTEPPTIDHRVNLITDAAYEVRPMMNYAATRTIVKKALNAGFADQAVHDALQRVIADGRSITTETVRVELEGLPERKTRTPDRAAEILRAVNGSA